MNDHDNGGGNLLTEHNIHNMLHHLSNGNVKSLRYNQDLCNLPMVLGERGCSPGLSFPLPSPSSLAPLPLSPDPVLSLSLSAVTSNVLSPCNHTPLYYAHFFIKHTSLLSTPLYYVHFFIAQTTSLCTPLY